MPGLGEFGAGRPVTRVPGSTQELYVFAGEPGSNYTVAVAVFRLIVGYPFRGGEARVAGGDRPGVLIAAFAKPFHRMHPVLAPFRAYPESPAERAAYRFCPDGTRNARA